ncbi:MAG: rod shape-determining protein MreD [Gemmatimonadales bacterium]
MRNVASQARFWGVLLLLVVLHFVLRPYLSNPRTAPDLVLVALLFFAIRERPGLGAVAGFLVGLTIDAVTPTSFGAGALAGTLVGFLSGWVKALFVADNVLITALFVFVGAWLRDAVEIVAGNQLSASAAFWQLLTYTPLAALTTAGTALVVLVVFRPWLARRTA